MNRQKTVGTPSQVWRGYLYPVGRLCWTGIIVVIACLFLASACNLGQDKTPSITVDSMQVKPGTALRVVGKNWQPGEQVVIGLNAPDALPKDSKPVTTALADASGSFVALFPLPADEPWVHMAEMWVVAHTHDFGEVAIASFSHTPVSTAIPTIVPAASATPSAEPTVYVLGYVENTSVSAGIIKVRPIEGEAEVITLVENTQIVYDGQPAQMTDIHVGDLVEASGQASPRADNTIIADRIRILARATAELTATPTSTRPALVWQGEYYNNTTFSGNPSVVRDDPVIDFQWQAGGAAEGLPVDNFAVRWTGSWPFEMGAYRFYAQVDDGVRLWLDEHMIIDQWYESAGALYSADAYLSAGSHAVRVEYFDRQGSAHARVWWEYRGPDAVQTYPAWRGEYYSNMTLSGPPFLVVNDRVLDFDWAAGIPATGMPGDDFSARWTRTVNLEEGVYRFYARVDDGVRLWVDETQLIDHWQEGAVETYSGEVYLFKGQHIVQVEYYEHTGLAVIKVWWELLPATPTPTSAPTQTPTHTPLPPTDTPLPPTPTPQHTPATPEPTPGSTSIPRPDSLFVIYYPLASAPRQKHRGIRWTIPVRLGGPTAAW
jgi:hypothetical protein